MEKISEEIKKIPHSKYNEVLEKVVEFCHENAEVVYKPKDFVEILDIDVSPKGLGASLRLRFQEIGLLKVYYTCDTYSYDAYFGYSKICGSRECFPSWCSSRLCRTGNGNEKLKFFNGKNNP